MMEKELELVMAQVSDLPQIVAIYNMSIPDERATADLCPVTLSERHQWFFQRDWTTRPIWVLCEGAQRIGWMSFGHFYGRPAYRHTCELAIYIHPEHQGRGFGALMLNAAIQRAPDYQIKTLLAFVFAHNESSIALFKKFGFAPWGMLPKVAQMTEACRDLCILGLSLDAT